MTRMGRFVRTQVVARRCDPAGAETSCAMLRQ
jgi:hypothetical protein